MAQKFLLRFVWARQGGIAGQQQCAVLQKYGGRGVGHSHEQGSGGRRGAFAPREGAKTVDNPVRVSR